MWRKQGSSARWFGCLNKVRWRRITLEHWKLPISDSFHSLTQFNSRVKLWSCMGVFYKLSWEHDVVLYTHLCRTSCTALYKQWLRHWECISYVSKCGSSSISVIAGTESTPSYKERNVGQAIRRRIIPQTSSKGLMNSQPLPECLAVQGKAGPGSEPCQQACNAGAAKSHSFCPIVL